MGASPPPPPQVNPEGWAQWPEPQFEEIDENEVNLVNNLADAAIANVVANGVM
jgi:Fe-S cluster biosynthesis and repair protein YggX